MPLWPDARLICLAVAFTSALAIPALYADPRVINVTSDSKPGWVPSEDLERQVLKAVNDYLAAEDGGKYADAYARLADINQAHQPFPAYSDHVREFNAKAGPIVERRVTTLTWTNDPANAPAPGIYTALDLVSRFTNIDRHCGFLVLYQAPSGGDFRVMREESNFLDNATAAGLSIENADKAWVEVSAHCPGYHAAAITSARPLPLLEAPDSSIGYPTVDAALAALHAKPGVTFRDQGGWMIADDTASKTIWSFPPKGHAAYPSAVKRQLITDTKGVSIDMKVQCEASKEACDDLVRAFQQMNAQIGAGVRH